MSADTLLIEQTVCMTEERKPSAAYFESPKIIFLIILTS